ncbi:AAA family ATPase [Desulfosporosinus sp. SB140]|uniref:AAA family ATPase n=1 Tax=Desulfosporosinus paludis TaxID=3115649 RepID=UPI00388E4B1B
MLKQINLLNYKSYDDRDVPLKPITLLCGRNSSGKTAIIKSILLLKQSFEATGNNYLLLNGIYTNNGVFENVRNHTSIESSKAGMGLSVTFSIDNRNPAFKELCRSIGMVSKRNVFSKFDICASFQFKQDKTLPQVALIESSTIELTSEYSNESYGKNEKIVHSIISMRSYDTGNQRYDILLENFPTPLYNNQGGYPFIYTNHNWKNCFCYFRGMQLVSLYKDNLSKKSTSALPVLYTIFRILATEFNKIEYLGPLREMPLRQYFVQDIYSNIGVRGENTAQYLGQLGNKTIDIPIPNDTNTQFLGLQEAVSMWAEQLGLGTVHATSTDIPGAKVTQIIIEQQNIADVGFGVSQVLPILVEGLAMTKGNTLILEQPEIHLHPKMQMDMADFLIAIARQGKHLIIETHSDHIINRMVRRAVEDKSLRDMLGIYFVEKNQWSCSELTEVCIDEDIGIDKAPQGFFDQYASESELILHAGYRNIMKKRGNQ